MPIIRHTHAFDDHFTRIPNDWVRDKRLSLSAIGLITQLMSHKPGWIISQESLARANKIGRDAMRTILNELLEAGYLTRSEHRTRNEKGQLAGYTYTTSEPTLDEPTLGEPTQAEPTHKKNRFKEEQVKEEQVKEQGSAEIQPSKIEYIKTGKLPDDWQPATELIAMFETKWPDVDQELHTENFKLHWWSTGRTMKRWDLAFQKWMNTEQDRAKKSNNRYNSKNDWNELDRWAKEQDGKDAN